jgi:pyruvate formate lyase activating enzyme
MNVSSGYIRKIETMGMLDGPGIRTVVFLSGCPLRCSYCHNPDMWQINEKDSYSVEELINRVKRLKPYYGNDGGVTFCGGEPLTQPEFLIELMNACKQEGINIALDTSGYGEVSYFDEILALVDLVLFDLKELDSEAYRKLTKVSIEKSELFLKKVQEHNVPLWIRVVLVPGLNDNQVFMDSLIKKIKEIRNVEKVELLPYHTLGVEKYDELGIDYPLKDIEAISATTVSEWQDYINQQLK